MKNEQITFIATSAMGLESIVADEIKALGYDPQVENGKITFTASLDAIARCNLWLRTADRLKIKIGECKVKTFDELYEATKALPWEQYISEDGEFPVLGKSHKSTLFSVSDCQAIVKKAIVDRLKWKYGIANRLEETGPLYKVEVAILNDVATLTIDSSGTGLHRRGYRVKQGEAPLKETLAAALILLTNWRGEELLLDPFCGSGTILIEAALIGQQIAPGFNRSFASENWSIIDDKIWEDAFTEAEDVAKYDKQLRLIGSDIDHRMVEASEQNALEAGLSGVIEWKQMQVGDLTLKEDNGYIVSNPPYGERMKDKKYVEHIYKEFGKIVRKNESWSIYTLTSHRGFEQLFGRRATKRRKLFNGFIETQYYQFYGRKNNE
ncbi:MAG TPA: class I SAM-dependent RNA methyltransferase [Pseudogracilibacillus sp.]|nr:class I SAM-dependent RNA methyltransferase [Pseudogracilibacillus sp.]